MCCFLAVLALLGPRLVLMIYWLFPAGRLRAMQVFDTWVWPVVGLIFLPWSTFTYTLVYANGIFGIDWLWLGLALLADLATYGGSASRRRDVGL